jgi:hypothetical protein
MYPLKKMIFVESVFGSEKSKTAQKSIGCINSSLINEIEFAEDKL